MTEITRSNPKSLSDMVSALKGLENVVGKVGWFASAHYADGTPVAYVAAIQEFGSAANSIPARPFMRTTAAEQMDEWGKVGAQVSERVLAGKMTPADAMEVLTMKAAGDVRHKISTIEAPPLSKITLGLRKYRQDNPGKPVTGSTVGMIARQLKEGTLDVSGVNDKPLEDSRIMITTLTNVVEGS